MTPLRPTLGARPRCPHCGSRVAPVPIIYGLPTHEAFEAEARGELVIGGCVIGDDSPDFECRDCGAALPWIAPDRAR